MTQEFSYKINALMLVLFQLLIFNINITLTFSKEESKENKENAVLYSIVLARRIQDLLNKLQTVNQIYLHW
jgi:hypothetical protein